MLNFSPKLRKPDLHLSSPAASMSEVKDSTDGYILLRGRDSLLASPPTSSGQSEMLWIGDMEESSFSDASPLIPLSANASPYLKPHVLMKKSNLESPISSSLSKRPVVPQFASGSGIVGEKYTPNSPRPNEALSERSTPQYEESFHGGISHLVDTLNVINHTNSNPHGLPHHADNAYQAQRNIYIPRSSNNTDLQGHPPSQESYILPTMHDPPGLTQYPRHIQPQGYYYRQHQETPSCLGHPLSPKQSHVSWQPASWPYSQSPGISQTQPYLAPRADDMYDPREVYDYSSVAPWFRQPRIQNHTTLTTNTVGIMSSPTSITRPTVLLLSPSRPIMSSVNSALLSHTESIIPSQAPWVNPNAIQPLVSVPAYTLEQTNPAFVSMFGVREPVKEIICPQRVSSVLSGTPPTLGCITESIPPSPAVLSTRGLSRNELTYSTDNTNSVGVPNRLSQPSQPPLRSETHALLSPCQPPQPVLSQPVLPQSVLTQPEPPQPVLSQPVRPQPVPPQPTQPQFVPPQPALTKPIIPQPTPRTPVPSPPTEHDPHEPPLPSKLPELPRLVNLPQPASHSPGPGTTETHPAVSGHTTSSGLPNLPKLTSISSPIDHADPDVYSMLHTEYTNVGEVGRISTPPVGSGIPATLTQPTSENAIGIHDMYNKAKRKLGQRPRWANGVVSNVLNGTLFSTTVTQLSVIIKHFDDSGNLGIPLIILISISMILQVVTGCTLVYLTINSSSQKRPKRVSVTLKSSALLAFLLFLVNIVIDCFYVQLV